jgi:hypothetical protein
MDLSCRADEELLARLRAEGRAADAAAMTRAATDQIAELEGVLAATLTVDVSLTSTASRIS